MATLNSVRVNLMILDCCPKCIFTFSNFASKEVYEKEKICEMEIQDRVSGPENGGSMSFRNVATSLLSYPRKPQS
jgi:hypothetical protein